MKQSTFSKISNTISLLLLILLISTASSFAYFSATLSGVETGTTITAVGGTMNINYNGGSNITMNNIFPRAEKWGTKTFTVTGNSTTSIDMEYTYY